MGGRTEAFQFDSTPSRLWAAVMQGIGTSGYTLLHSDPQARMVSFNTGRSMKSWGGQDLTATIGGDGQQSTLTMGGSLARGGNPLGGGSQIGAWGEKKKLIRKFAETVSQLLPSVPEPIATDSAPGGAAGLASEMEKLAQLHSSGALSDEEYQAAKARLLG